jgi:hypothetical protein
MSKKYVKIPEINLQVFMKLLQSFDTEKLRRIPIESLPESVPDYFVESLDDDKKYFLEGFNMAKKIARMKDYSINVKLFGEEIANVINQIKSNHLVNNANYFAENIIKLQKMADAHQLLRCADIPPIKLLKLSDSIHNMLAEIREEYIIALQYIPVIKSNYDKGAESKVKLKAVLEQLRVQLIPIHKMIISYYQTRLSINLCEMHHLKLKIQETERNILTIDDQVKKLSFDMEKFKSPWSKLAYKNDEVVSMQNQVNELFQMRKQLEVPIDENRLTRWLDSVVDIFIGPGTEDLANSKYADHAKRMIFFLLIKYCRQQENAAKDVAENPFIVINPEKAIDFLLSSEQFILYYFKNKRKAMASWVGVVVSERQATLDDIKKDLLVEMKKNIKYIR